jgi:hypothetical protein
MDQDQDSEVCAAALHASRSAAKAQQMVEQADRLITAAQELLTGSEAKLRAAIARRETRRPRAARPSEASSSPL